MAKKIVAIIAVLLFVAIIVFAGLFMYRYTDGFTQKPQFFYVQSGDKCVFKESRNNYFSKQLVLDVHYPFWTANKKFEYDIIPIQMMSYSVDGTQMNVANVKSFKGFFDDTVDGQTLTLKFAGLSLNKLLARVHNGADIVVGDVPQGDLFRLVVRSSDGCEISIGFSLVSLGLNVTEVIF